MNRTYIAIDLKSFYASVECRERELDALTTNLVVADESRTEKTICLAVSPSLKAFGIPGRPRLFEVVQKIKEVNSKRLYQYRKSIRDYKAQFRGESTSEDELKSDLSLAVGYIVAPPRMAYYMEYSTQIYEIYLRYIAPEDIHIYSIDEVFIDVTAYLSTYKMTAHELAMTIIRDVLAETGITATAGIGTNLYLCKIAMDIVAKKMPPDKDGVRIAELDERTYRELLWEHRPLTSFWRVGKGYAKKLEENGMFTMGDVALMSTTEYGENLLYKLFGINAELLIDHAWGWEPCTMQDIKSYKPSSSSLSSGQVLQEPYDFESARLIVREMTDLLSLDLVEKRLVTDQVVLTIGYDIESLKSPQIRKLYNGPITKDMYGRDVPKHAHGTKRLDRQTSSTKLIMEAVTELYEKIVNKNLLVRRVNIAVCNLVSETDVKEQDEPVQLDFFTDYAALQAKKEIENSQLEREKHIQQALIDIKNKFGKNAVLKGMSLQEGATSKERNAQIGGHKA